MRRNVLRNGDKATWDEQVATPSRVAPETVLHAHRKGVADTPRHPSADPDVCRLRVTSPTRCTCGHPIEPAR